MYAEQGLVQKGAENIQEFYFSIKNTITLWDDDIKIIPYKFYISFKRKTNFCDISIGKNQLKLWLNFNYGELEYICSVIKEAWMKK